MKTKLGIIVEKLIEVCWLAAVVTVPVYFNIYSARTFEPDKITTLRAIALVMIVCWVILLIERGRDPNGPTLTLRERWQQWMKAPLFIPTLLVVIVYLISTLLSIAPLVSFFGSYQRLQGAYSMLSYIAIFAVMSSALRTRAQIDRLITVMIITSIPVSLYGVIQRYGLDPLPWAGDVTTRVASTLGNAIFVSSYLIMVLPLAIVRLIDSMAAIVKDEDASWGHTVGAAMYIFVIAIQVLTIIFSRSRGPMIGVLFAFFVMGIFVLLFLRQRDQERSGLSLQEAASAFVFLFPLAAVSAIAGGIGYGIGLALSGLLGGVNIQLATLPVLGGLLGVMIGFFGAYAYQAAVGRGWRWMWLNWIYIGVLGVVFIIVLNLRGTGLDPYLDPVRSLPGLDRMSQVTATESGTGRVRVLIWDAALSLLLPHSPLGISDDPTVPSDSLNFLRPLVGYGPESMFNAFAFVYPPDLAHVENRGSSADRSHNETVDSLVMTGLFGFIAYYLLTISTFYYGVIGLGWATAAAQRRRLMVTLVATGVVGGVLAFLATGYTLTFVPLGVPVGVVAGIAIYLTMTAYGAQPAEAPPIDLRYGLVLVGVLGALIGHFIEVHFVFSIVATYTYFWVLAGVLIALLRSNLPEVDEQEVGEVEPEIEEKSTPEPRRARKGRGKRSTPGRKPTSVGVATGLGHGWQAIVASQGLIVAMIMMILTFNFVTPQFTFVWGDQNSMSLLWIVAITWGVGGAIILSHLAIQNEKRQGRVDWIPAVMLYIVSSVAVSAVYYLAHIIQFTQQIVVSGPQDVVNAANVLVNGHLMFKTSLFLLMIGIALVLAWRSLGRLPFWRVENWWLYPPLVLAGVALIWLYNFNVVWADMYLKEGDRYRRSQQWDQAILLHDQARSLDSDEDFYYLMLALDYQLMAQDGRLPAEVRESAWQRGEEIALEARAINPYNPDNTGNMGRYYFTLGQVAPQFAQAEAPSSAFFNRPFYDEAIDFFEKSTELAPSNVIYHNLWAQTHYIRQDYDKAVERLIISTEIDSRFPPTWMLLGDTNAAVGDVDRALEAHSRGMSLTVRGSDGFKVFADQALDQRLQFYISAGRGDDILAAMEAVARERPDYALVATAIARYHALAGNDGAAVDSLEDAVNAGDTSPATLQQLADNYLNNNQYTEALPLYEQLVQIAPNAQVHSALGFLYAQTGRIDEAIEQNLQVLALLPNDYDSLKNLAILYRQNQQIDQARIIADQARDAAPENERPSWDVFISELDN